MREVTAAAFGASHQLSGDPAGARPPGGVRPEVAARERGRTRHLARTDPGGCWIAQDEAAGPVGAVLSSRREGTWGMSLLAVAPGAQGKGVGKALWPGRWCTGGPACAASSAARGIRPPRGRTAGPVSPCTRRCG